MKLRVPGGEAAAVDLRALLLPAPVFLSQENCYIVGVRVKDGRAWKAFLDHLSVESSVVGKLRLARYAHVVAAIEAGAANDIAVDPDSPEALRKEFAAARARRQR